MNPVTAVMMILYVCTAVFHAWLTLVQGKGMCLSWILHYQDSDSSSCGSAIFFLSKAGKTDLKK